VFSAEDTENLLGEVRDLERAPSLASLGRHLRSAQIRAAELEAS
jgi:hypothetical protein